MNAVILRFPHGIEYQWRRDVPTVGQVVTRGASAWIVVSRDAGEIPSLVLRRYDAGATELVASGAAA